MTKQELFDQLSALGKEPGGYTEEEMENICALAKTGLSREDKIGIWGELAEKFGVNPGNSHKKGESLRSWYKARLKAKGELPKSVTMLNGKVIGLDGEKALPQIVAEQKRELYMAQTLARDVMNEYRDDLRKEARTQLLIKAMGECAGKAPNLEVPDAPEKKDLPPFREAVLLLSDMHIGMTIDSFCNRYNVEIASKRLAKLVRDVATECIRYNVKTLHVVDLGDEVHGLIHNSARLSQEYDVAEQVMIASDLIAQALNKLSAAVPEVTYRSCLDNHSRMMANYKDSKDTENFGRIIAFYLEARLAQNKRVTFPRDNLDPTLGLLKLANGEAMLFAHGHLDNPTQAVQEISGIVSSMEGGPKRVSYFCMGHYHSEKMKQYQGCRVIVNGAFCGTDDYASSRRLYNKPTQTMLVFDADNLIEARIGLDIRE